MLDLHIILDYLEKFFTFFSRKLKFVLIEKLNQIAFLRPSSSYDEMTKREHLDYTEAEKIGSSGESCEKIYENCKTSIMDIFTKIYV